MVKGNSSRKLKKQFKYDSSNNLHSDLMGMWQEFMDFIKKQNVLTVALGLITGFAAKDLVDALIKDMITPIYAPYIAFLNATASVSVGPSQFMIGDFVQSLISFLVILFVVFLIAKKVAKTAT